MANPNMGRSSADKQGQPARLNAIPAIQGVLEKHLSLSILLPDVLGKTKLEEQSLLQEIVYGSLRWYMQLEAVAQKLLNKPFKKKDHDIYMLVIIGLYQLMYMRVAEHAAVDETVAITKKLGKPWASGVVNATLRNYLRNKNKIVSEIGNTDAFRYSHPQWLVEKIKSSWPDEWKTILNANNERPPMTLRVNQLQNSRGDYCRLLNSRNIAYQNGINSPYAVTLDTPMGVEQLPGFLEGKVSVQDEAAQLAAILLDCKKGDRILDACAAPGGKTGHIYETCPDTLQLIALDNASERVKRIEENIARLNIKATVITADAGQPTSWWDEKPFDRILLDAPCSATGVIRRHPDIKYLRTPADIENLKSIQQLLLQTLWPLLKTGGKLVYATCSVLPDENEQQIKQFIKSRKDVHVISPEVSWGKATIYGRQILPGEHGMDGFYYACLQKTD